MAMARVSGIQKQHVISENGVFANAADFEYIQQEGTVGYLREPLLDMGKCAFDLILSHVQPNIFTCRRCAAQGAARLESIIIRWTRHSTREATEGSGRPKNVCESAGEWETLMEHLCVKCAGSKAHMGTRKRERDMCDVRYVVRRSVRFF